MKFSKQRLNGIGIFAISALVAGCSAHSPFIVKNTTDTGAPAAGSRFPAHHDKVYVTEQSLPPDVTFEVIGTIDVGKVWYGSSKNVLQSMADRAREMGANAVIEVKTWHQPSGFSWAAPHGSGQAVRITDPVSLERAKLNGNWL